MPTVQPPTPSPAPAARLHVGAVLDMRADSPSDGPGRWQGARLGVEMLNAGGGVLLPTGQRRELELVAYDSAGRDEVVARATARLAETDGALTVLADGRGDLEGIVRNRAERLAIPVLLLDEPMPPPSEPAHWTFYLAPTDADAMTVLVQFLANGVERVGWIAPRTATASAARSVLVAEAARTTIRVVAEESYTAGGEPAPDAMARLAFAGAQAIVGWPADLADAATLARLAAERAPGVTLYFGPVAAAPEFLPRVGEPPIGVRMIGPRLAVPDYLPSDDPQAAPIRQFLDAFRRRFGFTPSIQAAAAWDAVRLVAAAVQRSGADRARLRDALERSEPFAGASGPIAYSPARHNGLDGGAFVVARAERGKWVLPP
ncbi:MAG: ABC transporter substrate-binding protein [Chloroflexota bacterium]|nr:ABC transporter substrate-binding protein [Chloroflexota bacterium]